MLAEELLAVLETAGVGTRGTTLFGASAAALPSNGPAVAVVEYGGAAPIETHDGWVPIEQPRVQVAAYADDAATARTLAWAAWDALTGITNRLLNGTAYLRVQGLQTPFDMGPAGNGRVKWGFNVQVMKRRSAA